MKSFFQKAINVNFCSWNNINLHKTSRKSNLDTTFKNVKRILTRIIWFSLFWNRYERVYFYFADTLEFFVLLKVSFFFINSKINTEYQKFFFRNRLYSRMFHLYIYLDVIEKESISFINVRRPIKSARKFCSKKP